MREIYHFKIKQGLTFGIALNNSKQSKEFIHNFDIRLSTTYFLQLEDSSFLRCYTVLLGPVTQRCTMEDLSLQQPCHMNLKCWIL